MLAGALFTFGWLALGLLVLWEPSLYAILGIGLTLIFQRFVRKRPMAELWVRPPATPAPLDRRTLLLAAALAVVPLGWAVWGVLVYQRPLTGLWNLLCALGALPAARALRSLDAERRRWLLRALAVSLVVALAFHGGAAALRPVVVTGGPFERFARAAANLPAYLCAGCALEEVFFRGAFDAHAGRKGTAGVGSAIFIGVLGALWRAPLVLLSARHVPLAVVVLVWQAVLGTALCLVVRRSGNLAAGAAVRACIDVVRDFVASPI